MAQYSDQIAGMADGAGVPTGWTARWGTGDVTYTVGADAAAPGGKKLNVTHSANGRRLISYDGINADSDRATRTRIYSLIRINSDVVSGASYMGPATRGSGSASSETAQAAIPGLAGGSTTDRRFRVSKYDGGSFSMDDVAWSWATDGVYWVKIDAEGTSGTATVMPLNDPTGTPLATVNTTIPAANADNWAGIFSFLGDFDFLWFSVGTGTDDAPLPAAPVLSSPSGTQTGSSTADLSFSTTRANGTGYYVVTTSATGPSVAQIKAGQDHTGAAAADDGSAAVTATGTQNFSATGLAPETEYYAHFVHTDNIGNDSNVGTSASFTTAAATEVKGVIVTLYDGETLQTSVTGITAMWWDASPPTGNPVFTTATAATDASGVLEIDLDASTALNLTDPGHLMLYKLDGTDEKDSLGWQGRLLIQDIS